MLTMKFPSLFHRQPAVPGQIEPQEPKRKKEPAPAEAETGVDPIVELLKLVGEPNVVPFDRHPR